MSHARKGHRTLTIRHLFGLVMIATTILCPIPALAGDGIESVLRSAAASQPPPDLIIRYRDMNSFHGGTVIEIHGDGTFARWDTAGMREGFMALENEGALEVSRLAPLLKTLVDLEAWRQLSPDRRAVPDESQASFVVTAGTERSFIWEWYNEMAANKRIIRIRGEMEALVPTGKRRCVLPLQSPSSVAPLPGSPTCKGPA